MEKLWTEKDLADFLQQSILTVRRNRTAAPHRHPPFKKIGSSCRYDPAEVQKWLDTQTVNGLGTSSPSSEHPVRHRGRPKKEESVRKSRNGSK